MNRTFLGLALVVMLSLVNLAGSCASDSSSDRDDHHDVDQPNRIPRHADVVREGSGKLKWTADMDGTIYVFDRDKNTIRYTGDVRRGEEIVVQPDSDKVYVGGRAVFDQNLEKHSWHKLYFIGERDEDRNPR